MRGIAIESDRVLCLHRHTPGYASRTGHSCVSAEARKQCQRRRHTPPLRRCLVVSASQVKELPIFPLGVVAFPACQTPLHVFEAR